MPSHGVCMPMYWKPGPCIWTRQNNLYVFGFDLMTNETYMALFVLCKIYPTQNEWAVQGLKQN